MEIVENFDQWQADYFEEWLPHYEKTGELVWLNYPRAHNRTAPAGPGIDLAQSRLMFISSAGGYLRDEQEPFDAANELGDYSIRTFPVDTPFERIAFAHEHYDHTAVTTDPQVLLPLNIYRDMVARRQNRRIDPSVISYSGYQPDVSRILNETIPAILASSPGRKSRWGAARSRLTALRSIRWIDCPRFRNERHRHNSDQLERPHPPHRAAAGHDHPPQPGQHVGSAR